MLDHDDATMVLTILSRIDDIYSPHVPHNAGVTDERDHAPAPRPPYHTLTRPSTSRYGDVRARKALDRTRAYRVPSVTRDRTRRGGAPPPDL